MRLFSCQGCGNVVYFDNSVCVSCGRTLGWLPDDGTMSAVEPDGDGYRALGGAGGPVLFCDNANEAGCNWLLPADEGPGLCLACRHNHVVPDASLAANRAAWSKIETAKRHLFYSLMRWGLPCPTRAEDPYAGLAFDFVTDDPRPDGSTGKVMTGHSDGLITISLAEADDAERERRRARLGEPYRTLLGHFRHEIGHYYWDRLVRDGGRLDDFRAIFGDERPDYEAALKAHYANGPPSDWQGFHVSAYASSHPWEDFAETFAHTMHMVDGLETAFAFGIRMLPDPARSAAAETHSNPDHLEFDPYRAATVEALVEAWVPFTVAVNAVNRSVGQPDVYPFVLAGPVTGKLSFVLDLVRAARG